MYNYSEVLKQTSSDSTCLLGISVQGTNEYPYELNFQTPVLKCVKAISSFTTNKWNRVSFVLSDQEGIGHMNDEFADVTLNFTSSSSTLKTPKSFTLTIFNTAVYDDSVFKDTVIDYIHIHHATLDLTDYTLSQAIFTFKEV